MKSCSVCGQSATVYVVDLMDGAPTERYLCNACAAKMNITPQHFQITNMLTDLMNTLGLLQQLQPKQQKRVEDVTCDNCGMTYSQFKKTLRFGCAKDYELFNAASVLEQIHGTSQHVGKSPGQEEVLEIVPDPEPPKDYKVIRAELQAKLDVAVKSEDYETAAKLRDEIKTLPQSE